MKNKVTILGLLKRTKRPQEKKEIWCKDIIPRQTGDANSPITAVRENHDGGIFKKKIGPGGRTKMEEEKMPFGLVT